MIGLRTFALVLVGLVLLLIALVDIGYPSECEHARGLEGDGRFAEARKEYLEILRDVPASECATQGVAATTKKQCEAAGLLAAAGQKSEADKAYVAIATTEPAGDPAECARTAIATKPDSCTAADSQADHGLLRAAHKSYVGLLTSAKTADCAAAGLDVVTSARCAAARALQEANRPAAAEKLYKVIATTEPIRPAAVCVKKPQAVVSK